jgi:hypothetical protein
VSRRPDGISAEHSPSPTNGERRLRTKELPFAPGVGTGAFDLQAERCDDDSIQHCKHRRSHFGRGPVRGPPSLFLPERRSEAANQAVTRSDTWRRYDGLLLVGRLEQSRRAAITRHPERLRRGVCGARRGALVDGGGRAAFLVLSPLLV